ncbi:DUF167 domain-containing protein [Candidatus Latescibacterota bacterium]
MKVNIHIIPNASRNEITGQTDSGEYKVKVQSPPVDGAANKNLVKFISALVGVSKSKVRIVSGLKSRKKILEIDGDEKIIRQYMGGEICQTFLKK